MQRESGRHFHVCLCERGVYHTLRDAPVKLCKGAYKFPNLLHKVQLELNTTAPLSHPRLRARAMA